MDATGTSNIKQAYVEVDFVKELASVAHKHDGNDPPVDSPQQPSFIDRSRLSRERAGLVVTIEEIKSIVYLRGVELADLPQFDVSKLWRS